MSCPFKHLQAEVSATSGGTTTNGGTNINKLVTFMQGSPDAAFLLDHEGKILYRNKAAQLMFLTNAHKMSLTSIFTFMSPTSPTPTTSTSTWDTLAAGLTNSDPTHHDVSVLEDDGTQLAFRLNLVKLPIEIMGEANSDVHSCAYVTPAHDHDHIDGIKKLSSVSEHDAEEDVSGSERVDEDMQKLHDHMKDVVHASLDPMVCLHANGTIILANQPAVNTFGYSHSELVGKDIASICPTAREVQNVLNIMNAPSINKQQITTATAKSGEELSIELGLSLNQSFAGTNEPVFFAHMKDLSEMEEHKAAAEHKEDLAQAMINASFDSMFSIDQRGKIIVVNEAACQAFGYTRDEFIGKNISMICNDRDAVNHDKHLERYIRTGQKRVIGRKRPLVARRKDGTEFHIELGVSEVFLLNGEKMFCGYVRDRTQERLDKQMLRRKDAVIQGKFFSGMKEEDARGALKRNVPNAGRATVA